MNNFLFENKTKVYFGKGGVKEYLGCLLEHYGDTVMLAYGGGSIKHNGVYDEIVGILNAEGKRIVEFPGIMPNPTYAKVQEGAKLARENHVDLILAVGGGAAIYFFVVKPKRGKSKRIPSKIDDFDLEDEEYLNEDEPNDTDETEDGE